VISFTTNRFWKAYQKLDGKIKVRAKKAFELFKEDPNHPSLEFKKIHATEPVYSARVTLSYRAVGIRDKNEIVWVWIGSHEEYERFIKAL
jgi:hypothetical protein